MRRILVAVILVWAAMSVGPFISDATACPMCKEANESDDRRPTAYMYSILFMLAMPATIFTGFGIGFYRLSKKQDALNQDAINHESGVMQTEGYSEHAGESTDNATR